MAAAVANGDKSEDICNQNYSKDSLKKQNVSTPNNCHAPKDEFSNSWGFNIDELYALSTTFLKEKEGKAFNITYKDKLLLVAYSQQVAHGPYVEDKSPAVGYLDVIGRDRRQAWQSLGSMQEREAKAAFINLLHSICPLFRPFILAHRCHLDEEERKRLAEEERRRQEAEEEEQIRLEEEQLRLEEEKRFRERQKQGHQKRLIQEALNRQTFHQFKDYAEKQFPGNPEQQAVLIRQLQEQHYQQYMQQVMQEQMAPAAPLHNNHSSAVDMQPEHTSRASTPDVSEEEICDPLPVAAAKMWTRPDLTSFKESIRKEGGDGIITVGHGETVTVRVPTHQDGSCLFWEFATDSFDLGFGVYFEWGRSSDSQVTVHISESEDEEEEEEELDPLRNDVEKGAAILPLNERPPLSVVIPVYRRDCHEEVYVGSHIYPGHGVYQLKFDNSYSLWRSKTLYYRVYYTQ